MVDSITNSNQALTLRWQFQLTWRLVRVHLPALTDEMCLWEPGPGSWTVRETMDGIWRPDWTDMEPNPGAARYDRLADLAPDLVVVGSAGCYAQREAGGSQRGGLAWQC